MSNLFANPVLQIEDLIKFQRPVPRYTSYPPVPSWSDLDAMSYERALEERALEKDRPISVYIHVPFCKSMCLFCGCHVILNRLIEQREHYADLVEREIDMLGKRLGKITISQLHLGGGTPTYMPLNRLNRWIDLLNQTQGFTKDAEISIEVDPRTVMDSEGKMLHDLKAMGFNRVSFGVQDLDEEVQQAVRRRQSAQMSQKTLEWAKEAGFESINIDLIYGLPKQTAQSFEQTIRALCSWKPSRIALFSYANVPWLKAHQKVIADKLPPTEKKLELYLIARDLFLEHGYRQIGMDHFALENDEMTKAFDSQNLQRNFQGYSLHKSEDLIGLGVSSTGYVSGIYVQNVKEVESYEHCLTQNRFAVFRGKALNEEDKRRHWVIQRVMCDFSLEFDEYDRCFERSFEKDFADEMEKLKSSFYGELIKITSKGFEATSLGRIFIRLVASCFDAYLKDSANRFSMSI